MLSVLAVLLTDCYDTASPLALYVSQISTHQTQPLQKYLARLLCHSIGNHQVNSSKILIVFNDCYDLSEYLRQTIIILYKYPH